MITDDKSIGLRFSDRGIANILAERTLTVPVNQRPYKWEANHVEALFHDLTKAFDESHRIYFLGTITLTRGPKDEWQIADGQQRLATTSILIAAIRDYLLELGDQKGAETYQTQYLLEYDPPTNDYRAKLRLNQQDNDFFFNRIVLPPAERKEVPARLSSQERLELAAQMAHDHVRNITAALKDSDKKTKLYEWLKFLHQFAVVVEIIAPGYINAFKMFETLNARALEASQIDILKNFLFDKAKNRLDEIQANWLEMVTKIEAIGDDELLLAYIRHFWITRNGPTREQELGERIESAIQSERQSVELVSSLETLATDYVALLSPNDSQRWSEFSSKGKSAIATITQELQIEQIRPLMLSVASTFPAKEAERAFHMFLSWCVRFLIVGGGGGGVLDRHYGMTAMEVVKKRIKTAEELAKQMADVIPNDTAFIERFTVAAVGRTHLARYYLRAIELHLKQDPEPELLPNQETTAINLEHILPSRPASGWNVAPDDAATFHKRIGNMTLLGAKDNVDNANKTFAEKKAIYKKSPFLVTSELAKYTKWGPDEIRKRQEELAKLAPKIWPLKWK